MVKNTKGGNKSKGIARKHIAGSRDFNSLRLSTSDFEIFGVISKLLGNGMFYIVSYNFNQLLGHIRKKFKGRSKRDNSVTVGSVVLVGLRDWEAPNFKECDLLEVYDANEVRQLMKIPSIDLTGLYKHIDMYSGTSNEAGESGCADIVFTEDRDYNDGLLPDFESESGVEKSTGVPDDEIVDIEDI